MKLILHCGFPKTGTTSLQKWFSQNVDYLNSAGVDYPADLRDSEGYGHHNLPLILNQSSCLAADRLISICNASDCPTVFISAEALANYVSTDQLQKSLKFTEMLHHLTSSNINVKLLFTLRSVDSYSVSIFQQNLLFDRTDIKPSVFCSHTIDSLARSYTWFLDNHQLDMEIFPHSMNVNFRILHSLINEASGSERQNSILNIVEHRSPSAPLCLFFMWCNSRGIVVPADLVSYLRFHSSAHQILSSCYAKVCAISQVEDTFLDSWKPPAELIHSALLFYQVVWSRFYDSDSLPARGTALQFLTDRVTRDLPLLLSRSVARLDYLYYVQSSHRPSDILLDTFEQLLCVGSEELGQNFHSQL